MSPRTLIAIIAILFMTACTPNLGTFTDPAQGITAKEGSRFTIELAANATTGYSWKFETPFDASSLKRISSEYLNPNTALVGSGGIQVWIFECLKPRRPPSNSPIPDLGKKPPLPWIAFFRITIED